MWNILNVPDTPLILMFVLDNSFETFQMCSGWIFAQRVPVILLPALQDPSYKFTWSDHQCHSLVQNLAGASSRHKCLPSWLKNWEWKYNVILSKQIYRVHAQLRQTGLQWLSTSLEKASHHYKRAHVSRDVFLFHSLWTDLSLRRKS